MTDKTINIILKAADKASKTFDRIKKSSSGLSGELAKNKKEMRDLERAQTALVKIGKAEQYFNRLNEQIIRNSAATSRLTAEIDKTGVATKKQAAELKKLTREGERLNNEYEKQSAQLKRYKDHMEKVGVSGQNLEKEQAEIAARMQKTTAQIEKQSTALEKLEKRQQSRIKAAAIAGIASGVSSWTSSKAATMRQGAGHAINTAMSEEDAMQGLIRQVGSLKNADGSLNHAEIARMRTEVQKLSDGLPMATVEIMKMMTAGAKMNIPRQELAAYVTEAVKAANAFEAADPEALAEELGRIRQNFKLSKEAASELVNVMNYLDDNALVSGDQLISYMNEVSGSMGLAKMGEKHVAALGSALISTGVESSTAAKAVGSLMTRLGTAPDMKPVREALKSIGMDAKSVQKGMVEDAQGTLEKIIAAVQKMPKEQQAGILKGLAGGEYNRVFAQLVANTELWREQIRLATSPDALGSLDKEFEIRVNAMSSKWQMFKNKLFNTESGFGRSMFSGLEYGMNVISGLLDKFNEWSAKNPEAAAKLGKIAFYATAAMTALAGLAAVIAAVAVPFAAARIAFGGFGMSILKVLGIALRFMTLNPIGLALTAIIGIIYLVYTNWDTLTAAFIRGWEWIKKTFAQNPILYALTGPIGAIVALATHWDRIKNALIIGWGWIKKTFSGNNPISYALSAALGPIGILIKNFQILKNVATSAWEWMKKAFSTKPTAPGGSAAGYGVGAYIPNKGYSTGGYTGAGGVNQAAGIVHKGEVVFNQQDVARFGGWRVLEKIRKAGLGALQSIIPAAAEEPRPSLVGAVPVSAGFNHTNAGGMTVNITINGGSQSPADIAREVARQIKQIADQAARRARSAFSDD